MLCGRLGALTQLRPPVFPTTAAAEAAAETEAEAEAAVAEAFGVNRPSERLMGRVRSLSARPSVGAHPMPVIWQRRVRLDLNVMKEAASEERRQREVGKRVQDIYLS